MIKDFGQLIERVTRESGHSDVANDADFIVSFAENYLNKQLRLASMQTDTTISMTMVDGQAKGALPDDYLEARLAVQGECVLENCTLKSLIDGFDGYAITKNNIHTQKAGDLDLLYFAKLPSLLENETNHLLESDPELYLTACLAQVYRARKEFDLAGLQKQYLDALLDDLNKRDRTKRRGGSIIHMRAPRP